MDSTETGYRRYNSLIEGLYKIRQDTSIVSKRGSYLSQRRQSQPWIVTVTS